MSPYHVICIPNNLQLLFARYGEDDGRWDDFDVTNYKEYQPYMNRNRDRQNAPSAYFTEDGKFNEVKYREC